jgi:transposase
MRRVSYRDIAKKCGLSPGTVQKILEKFRNNTARSHTPPHKNKPDHALPETAEHSYCKRYDCQRVESFIGELSPTDFNDILAEISKKFKLTMRGYKGEIVWLPQIWRQVRTLQGCPIYEGEE